MIQYMFSSKKANVIMAGVALAGIAAFHLYAVPRSVKRQEQNQAVQQKANAEFNDLNKRFQLGIDRCFEGSDGNPGNGIHEPAEVRNVARIFGYENPVNYGTQIVVERDSSFGARAYFDSSKNAVVVPDSQARNVIWQWENRGCKF